MTDGEVRGWRALPPVLVVAIALELSASLAGLVWAQFAHGLTSEVKWGLAVRGIYFASTVLSVVGYVELARRRTGWARRGLHAAAILVAAEMLLWVIVAWYFAVRPPSEDLGWFETFWKIAALVLRAAPAIGLALAAWDRRALAIAGLVLTAGVDAAHGWLRKLVHALDLGEKGYFTLVSAIAVAGTIALALLAYAAARGTASPEPRRAAHGLSRCAGALSLRVFAALATTGIVLLLALAGTGGEGAAGLVKLGLFSGLVINFVADLWFAASVLDAARAELPDLPRWPLALAGAAIAWCSGVLLEKGPDVYQVLYGHESGRDALETLAQFSLLLPVVETLGIGAVAAVIGVLASRRSLPELGQQASGKGIGFVALMFAGIAITNWVVPEAKSEGGLIMMMLCALVAMFAALLLMIRLCRIAADAVEQEPGLPPAKLVSP